MKVELQLKKYVKNVRLLNVRELSGLSATFPSILRVRAKQLKEDRPLARIAGIDLPKNKRIEIALTYIYGIGQIHGPEHPR